MADYYKCIAVAPVGAAAAQHAALKVDMVLSRSQLEFAGRSKEEQLGHSPFVRSDIP